MQPKVFRNAPTPDQNTSVVALRESCKLRFSAHPGLLLTISLGLRN